MQVSVFGNPDLPADAMPLSLIPALQEHFPNIEFIHQDPNEECAPFGDIWYIIDAVKGIDKVRLITDTDLLQVKKRLTLHDYDLGMHLTLLKKIYPKLQLRIIGIPLGSTEEAVLSDVISLLSTARSSD